MRYRTFKKFALCSVVAQVVAHLLCDYRDERYEINQTEVIKSLYYPSHTPSGECQWHMDVLQLEEVNGILLEKVWACNTFNQVFLYVYLFR